MKNHREGKDSRVQLKSTPGGPAEYFAKHPTAYALSLSGAAAAVAIFTIRAAGVRGARRFGWTALAALEAFIFIGMVIAREGARRSPSTRKRSS